MGATFPNGIASFSTKRNLFDDVDASDVNRIQDEIVALQSVLGPLINEVHTIESTVEEMSATDAALAAQDALLAASGAANLAADELRESQSVQRFTDLKARLDYMQAGKHQYAFYASGGPYVLAPQVVGTSGNSSYLQFGAPGAAQDPMAMYNGYGFTLKKSGFWLIHGLVRYDTNDGKGDKNMGIYQATVSVGGQEHRGIDRDNPTNDQGWRNVMLNPVAFGWFGAGTQVYLTGKQTTAVNQTITSASIAGFMVREF